MKAWDDFLTKQKIELGEEIVKKWLTPLQILRYDAANLYLEAKDHFQALWFEEHIRPKLKKTFVNNNHRPIQVHLAITNAKNHPQKKGKKVSKKRAFEEPSPEFQLTFDPLDPCATFDRFITTETNLIPRQLIQEVVDYFTNQETGKFNQEELATYNPIYLHGHSGSGKTHLLMAAANALTKAGVKAIYTRSETFTSHVVNAIRAGEMSIFRQTYRNADVLIIDDVHLFSRKGATQEELFHTFNALHLSGKHLILSSHCAPKDLQMIEPRLISRFEWGIVLPLGILEEEKIEALIKQRADYFQLDLSDKLIKFLKDTFKNHPKNLVRAIEALVLRLHTGEYSVNALGVNDAANLLSDLVQDEKSKEVTPEKILSTVAEHYSLPIDEIRGKSQKKEVTLPRQITMFLCRNHLNLPYMKIGDFFNKDHSTVMSGIKRVQKSYDNGDKELKATLSTLLDKLQA